jgi:4-carboxymuconolactone decarboxylase
MTEEASLFERGLAVRREVLGDEYVNSSLARTEPFDLEFQKYVTEFCWGSVWTRDGLPRQVRSLLNVAIMTAINRPHELELHTRGALRNGCTIAEIQETIMQVTAYCGVPAALDGLRVVRAVFDTYDPTDVD